jgi:hypothetical protein
MKESDVQKEVRVWQRVRQENQTVSPLRENLQGLIMEQALLAAAYLQLSHRTGGLEATTLMRLARQSRAQAACLRGVWALLAEEETETRIIPPQKGTKEAQLRRCYGQELRLLQSYEKYSTDAEYGPVFERMAQRAREHCCLILELVGQLGKR